MMTNKEKIEHEMLLRQLHRLQKRFTNFVRSEEEADKMLDWINEIRKQIAELEKK